MFTRSILIPSLLVSAICAPILLSEPNVRPDQNGQPTPDQMAYPPTQFTMANGIPSSPPSRFANETSRNLSARAVSSNNSSIGQQVPYTNSRVATDGSTGFTRPASIPFGLAPIESRNNSHHQSHRVPVDQTLHSGSPTFDWNAAFGEPASRVNTQLAANKPANPVEPQISAPTPTTMRNYVQSGTQNHPRFIANSANALPPSTFSPTPDWGRAETIVYPGNENGPDLSAQPLDYVPVSDFREIFRFDINADWVKHRWNRVSTTPKDVGLRGLRVALVTGTNSWDLHGSLTYYFDSRQRLQRIAFRGWTGDPSHLLQMLNSVYGFEPQPSLLAGFFLAKRWRRTTGALLMKEPPVIRADNPIEKMAIVMEINRPDGKFEISEDIQLLIAGSAAE